MSDPRGTGQVPGDRGQPAKETGINDITVTCGCGRKMTQRGTDPKGTLRCGCGVRVTVQARMTGLMPDEILATEPGGRDLEKLRHKQFEGLRVRGERFVRDPELLSHIQMIRSHYGEPKMTGYLPQNPD